MGLTYRILFLGYWNLNDGLTHATILPHLRILKEMSQVAYLHFANTQREELSDYSTKPLKELHVPYTPLFSKNIPVNQFNKIYDFIYFPKLVKQLCIQHNINLIIARGTPAGSLAYFVWQKLKIPFVVESFEPHADYMRTSGVWKAIDLRYLFQKYWEKKQKEYSIALITVARNYKNHLINEGIEPEKIFVVPCAVDPKKFYPDELLKHKMRSHYKIPDKARVGVYAGKFGGLYLEKEAFEIFKKAFTQISDFYLLLLTNSDSKWLQEQIFKYNLPKNRVIIQFVPHSEVNAFLNMADFAFALYKNTAVSSFLSPIKIGEYWAVGLPVLITPNLGDEFTFLENESLGIVLEKNEVNWSSLLLTHIDINSVIKNRSLEKVKQTYNQILN